MLDFRQGFALGAVILYAFCTVFLIAYALQNIKLPMLWLSLFWIILFFASINAIAKSFVQEPTQRNLYYYTLATPEEIIIAKILYNCLLTSVLSGITFFIYTLFLPPPPIHLGLLILVLILSANTLSILLTMVSAIAAQTKNAALLSGILSIPLLMPLLTIVQKLSVYIVNYNGSLFQIKELYILLGLGMLIAALNYILYPYLCKD